MPSQAKRSACAPNIFSRIGDTSAAPRGYSLWGEPRNPETGAAGANGARFFFFLYSVNRFISSAGSGRYSYGSIMCCPRPCVSERSIVE